MHIEPATVLAVDDDPLLREFAKMRLTRPNVTVEVAANGDDAWYRLGKGGVDIVLLDLEMPVLDGFELLGLIRSSETTRQLPVVVATSRSDAPAIARAFAAGATSFVLKPLVWDLVAYQLSYVLRVAREERLVRQALGSARAEILQNNAQVAASITKLEAILANEPDIPESKSTNYETTGNRLHFGEALRQVADDLRACLTLSSTGSRRFGNGH